MVHDVHLRGVTHTAEFMMDAAAGIIAAAFILSQPAQAGTCSPVIVKGHAADPAAATPRAHAHEAGPRAPTTRSHAQEAARIGGKVKQNSTDGKPVSGGF